MSRDEFSVERSGAALRIASFAGAIVIAVTAQLDAGARTPDIRRSYVVIGTDSVHLGDDSSESERVHGLPAPGKIEDRSHEGAVDHCYAVRDAQGAAYLTFSHEDLGMGYAALQRTLRVPKGVTCPPIAQPVYFLYGGARFDLATTPAELERLLGPGAAWKQGRLKVERDWHEYFHFAPPRQADSARAAMNSGIAAERGDQGLKSLGIWQWGGSDPE